MQCVPRCVRHKHNTCYMWRCVRNHVARRYLLCGVLFTVRYSNFHQFKTSLWSCRYSKYWNLKNRILEKTWPSLTCWNPMKRVRWMDRRWPKCLVILLRLWVNVRWFRVTVRLLCNSVLVQILVWCAFCCGSRFALQCVTVYARRNVVRWKSTAKCRFNPWTKLIFGALHFCFRHFPAPRHPIRLLEATYGNSWQIPDGAQSGGL